MLSDELENKPSNNCEYKRHVPTADRSEQRKHQIMAPLKLYTAQSIPNPDVVEMYLEETGRQHLVENIFLNRREERKTGAVKSKPFRRGAMLAAR